MAGDWIKMNTNLHENPRVVELAEILGLDELYVVGMLWRVWSWADGQTLSGEEMNITERRINKMVGCDGFCSALRDVGWLYGEDRALSFTNFDEHNGTTAKKRALGRNRNQKYRGSKGVDVEGDVSACNVCDAMGCKDGDADDVTPVTQKASLEKRREEKRRCPLSNERGTGGGVLFGVGEGLSSPSQNTDMSLVGSVAVPGCCEDVVGYLLGLESALPLSERRVVAEAWHEEMLAKGWMLGRTRCRDWRAALRRKLGFVLKDRAEGLGRGAVAGGARRAGGFVPNDNANRGRSYEL